MADQYFSFLAFTKSATNTYTAMMPTMTPAKKPVAVAQEVQRFHSPTFCATEIIALQVRPRCNRGCAGTAPGQTSR